MEQVHRLLGIIHISNERNMFVAENFIRSLISKYSKHTVYTDGGTWYAQACNLLHLKHNLQFSLEKSLIVTFLKTSIELKQCLNQLNLEQNFKSQKNYLGKVLRQFLYSKIYSETINMS